MTKEYRFVPRPEFDEIGKKQHKNPNVITRAWNNTVRASNHANPNHRPSREADPATKKQVNFDYVMKSVRYLESGQSQTMWLGKTAWNIITAINNRDKKPGDPDFLIDWSPHVHDQLRNGPERRARAAARLEEAYDELSMLALRHAVELTLPDEN